jgi:hypothetical protein
MSLDSGCETHWGPGLWGCPICQRLSDGLQAKRGFGHRGVCAADWHDYACTARLDFGRPAGYDGQPVNP